jgi:trehalose monomycolate/heme transporter
MFAVLGRAVTRASWPILLVGLVFSLLGVVWGTGVIDQMTVGEEFTAPGPAADARHQIERVFPEQQVDVIVLYSSTPAAADTASTPAAASTVDDPAFQQAVTTTLTNLRGHPEVAAVSSYYDTQVPELVSRDRKATYAVLRLTATSSAAKMDQLRRIHQVTTAPGLRTQLGGTIAFQWEAHQQVGDDLRRAELLSMPVLLLLLVLIFRGLVAAATPLLVGGLAILTALTATRIIALFTGISVFALNIITLLGLGMAIDYALFIVSRFREELATGSGPAAAILRTMETAGRTVATSGTIVALSLGSLLLFPRVLLRSLALGGMAAVGLAMVVSLTVLPALLLVLGPRINTWSLPLTRASAKETQRAGEPAGIWARIAHSVMGHPVRYLVSLLLLLCVLAAPFHRARFGPIDERIMPSSAASYQVARRLDTEFAAANTNPIGVLLTGLTDQEQLATYLVRLRAVAGVTGARSVAARGNTVLVTVTCHSQSTSATTTSDIVRRIRALPSPAGGQVAVAGLAASLVDGLDDLGHRLPGMLIVVVLVLLTVLLVAFRSVVIPIKAVLTTMVSVGASFGAMVWVFQDGHLRSQLQFTSSGALDADMMVLMLAVLFGLSTDYEVFLLSRIREQWLAGSDTTTAVALGLERTGGIITSAAALLMVVVGGFTAGGLLFIKMLGVGMIVAILVDAALVRPLLVPATLRLLGKANWWAPRCLRVDRQPCEAAGSVK